MKRMVNEFTSNTSGHGWGMIGRTNSKFGKLLWAAITLGSTIAAIAWVTTVIQRYAQFETKDRVELRSYVDIAFPSVTVCPLYGYSPRKLGGIFSDPESTFVLQNTFLSSFSSQYGTIMQMTNETLDTLHGILLLAKSNRGFYENIGESNISDLSHELHNLVPHCLYQGIRCIEEDFTKLVHHEYKNCYTFNGKDVNLTNPIVAESGAQNGLSLTLYLEHSDYTYANFDPSRAVTAAAGARVIIHEKGTLPDPDNDGFDVEPGHLINVALSVNKRELMKPPWGKCADHTILHSTDFKYTRNTCKRKCMEKMIEKQCGCWKDLLPVDLNGTRDADMQACGKFNMKEWLDITKANVTFLKEDIARFKCQRKKYLWSEVSESMVDCECEYSCSYLTYNVETSQSEWPMRGSELDFYCSGFVHSPYYYNLTMYEEFHDKVGVHCTNYFEFMNVSHNWGDKLRANFLRVNVYFKDLETKYTIEEEDFPLVSMISEIGGVLGIFIGVSLITILEVFVLCSGIVHAIIGRKKISNEIHVKEIMSTPENNSGNFSDHKPDDSDNDRFKRY